MEGQRALITDFIYENQESMYRLAFAYVRSREAALDIVQETVVQALTHASSLRAAEAVKAWVYRILVNESLAYLRRNKRFLLVEALPEEETVDEDIGERLDVYRAVERLDPKFKTVVMLRFYEDMKLEDIARITGTNLNTVKSRLYTALGRLKEELGCEAGPGDGQYPKGGIQGEIHKRG